MLWALKPVYACRVYTVEPQVTGIYYLNAVGLHHIAICPVRPTIKSTEISRAVDMQLVAIFAFLAERLKLIPPDSVDAVGSLKLSSTLAVATSVECQ